MLLCPSCGKPLAASAPKGLCQECLLKAAFPTGTETGGKAPPFNPPTVADLSGKFPQLEVIELIGSGGMGAVYKARAVRLAGCLGVVALLVGVTLLRVYAERSTQRALLQEEQARQSANEAALAERKAESRATTDEGAVFGPVITRVIQPAETGTNLFLDLDAGQLLTPPKEIRALFNEPYVKRVSWERNSDPRAMKMRGWLRSSGANLMISDGGLERLEMREGMALAPRVISNDVVVPFGFDQADPNYLATRIKAMLESPSVIPILQLQPGFDPQLNTRWDSFCFRTRQGAVGILQILNPEDNPRGVRIRYKLLQPGPELSGNPSPQNPRFQFERVLKAKDECFLDLDTGQTHGPVVIGGETDLPQSMDLSIPYTQLEGSFSAESVVGLDHLEVLPATSADWDITPDDLETRLKPLGPQVVGGSTRAAELANRQSEVPRTYFFRTPGGNEGVLQIVAFARNSGGVKLRYRLVQTVPSIR